MLWPANFDKQLKSDPLSIHSADPLFSLPLGEHTDKWEIWLSKEAFWDRYRTLSHIANLKGEQVEVSESSEFHGLKLNLRQTTKKYCFDILDGAPKNDNGEIAFHGNTFAYWTTAIPSDTLRNGG